MSEPLWPNERIMEELEKYADENEQIVFSDAAWPVLEKMRDEMVDVIGKQENKIKEQKEKIDRLEREAITLWKVLLSLS